MRPHLPEQGRKYKGCRVAVCYAAANERSEYMSLVSGIFDRIGVDYTVLGFAGSRDLLAEVRTNGFFDLYLIDLQLNHENGLDAAYSLRNLGDDAAVILSAQTPERAIDGYKVRADDYLLKPIRQDVLEESILRVMKVRRTMIFKTTQGELCPVEMNRIEWAESFAHQTEIHADGRVYSIGRMLSELVDMLGDRRFYRNHRSYLVNLDYVAGVDKHWLRLADGTKLPISRGSRSDIQTALDHRLGNA